MPYDGVIFQADGLSVGDLVPLGASVPASSPTSTTRLVAHVFYAYELFGTSYASIRLGFYGFKLIDCFPNFGEFSDDPAFCPFDSGGSGVSLVADEEAGGGNWGVIGEGKQIEVLEVDLTPSSELFIDWAAPSGPFPVPGSIKIVIHQFSTAKRDFECHPPPGGGVALGHNGFGHAFYPTPSAVNASTTFVAVLGTTPVRRLRLNNGPDFCHGVGFPGTCPSCNDPPSDGNCFAGGSFSYPAGPWQEWDPGQPVVGSESSIWFHFDLAGVTGGIDVYSGVDAVTGGSWSQTWVYDYTPCFLFCGALGWSSAFHMGYNEIGTGLASSENGLAICEPGGTSCQALETPGGVGLFASPAGVPVLGGAGAAMPDDAVGLSHVRRRTPGLGAA